MGENLTLNCFLQTMFKWDFSQKDFWNAWECHLKLTFHYYAVQCTKHLLHKCQCLFQIMIFFVIMPFFLFFILQSPLHVFNKELLKMRRDSRGHMYKWCEHTKAMHMPFPTYVRKMCSVHLTNTSDQAYEQFFETYKTKFIVILFTVFLWSVKYK